MKGTVTHEFHSFILKIFIELLCCPPHDTKYRSKGHMVTEIQRYSQPVQRAEEYNQPSDKSKQIFIGSIPQSPTFSLGT